MYGRGPQRIPRDQDARLLERLKSLEQRLSGMERHRAVTTRFSSPAISHAETITGDGTETEFTIAHNKETFDLQVAIRTNFGTPQMLDPADYAIEFSSINAIKVTFDTAPGSGDEYRVMIVVL